MEITNGFILCYWDLIRPTSHMFFAPIYQGSGNTEAMTYVYTLQGQNGYAIVYIRKGDGTVPANGKIVGGRIYVEVTA